MAYDAHSNFGYSTVLVAPVPAATGVSLTVQAGHGALFPTAPFNCTVWPSGTQPLASNAEIVRVTAVVGDTLTIVRGQEGSTPVAIAVGFQIANTTSRIVFTDIENSIIQFINAGVGQASASLVSFADGNGISFGAAGNTITASHNALTSQSNQAASASNGSFAFQTLNFSDGNNVTFLTAPGGIIFASVAPAGAGASINFSAGTTSNNLSAVTFANSNGITFGLNAGTITASHNGLTSQSNQAASAGNGSFTFQTLNFADTNGISFSTSAGSIIFASHNGITSQSNQVLTLFATSNTTQATSGTQNASSILFAGAGNVSVGISNGSIVISGGTAAAGGGATLRMFEPYLLISSGTGGTSSLQQMVQFMIPQHLSMAYGRVAYLMATSASNITTLNSASATASAGTTMNNSFLIFTFGQGASSASIVSVGSGTVAYIWSNHISITNSSQYTLRMGVTYPISGGTSESSFQLITSASVYSFNVTSNFPGFSSGKFFDIPCSVSLTPGNYWAGHVADLTTQSAGAVTQINRPTMVPGSIFFVNRVLGAWEFGGSDNQVMGFSQGAVSAPGGLFTSLNRSDIQQLGLARGIYFQLHSVSA